MTNIENTQSHDTPSTSYNPWHYFTSFNIYLRVVVCIATLIAIAAVTLWAVRTSPHISEIISAYITIAFLQWLAAIDYKTYTIPNKILLRWLCIRTVLVFANIVTSNSTDILISSAGGATLIGIFFLVAHYLSKRSLGGGDVKLSFVLGLSLTLSMIFSAIFYALIACGAFALIGLASKKLTRKDVVPLGPFFLVGTIVTYFFSAF